MSNAFKRLLPTLNRLLIKKIEPQTTTKSGLILSSTNDKVQTGTVIEKGPGFYDNDGNLQEVQLNIGDQVVLPDFGGAKVLIQDGEFYIYRDTEILGVLKK